MSSGFTNRESARRVEARHRDLLAGVEAGFPEAERQLAEFVASVRGKELPGSYPTLAGYAPRFLKWSETVHRKATHALHRSNLGVLARHLGTRRLDDIQRADVEDFMTERLKEPVVNSSWVKQPDGTRALRSHEVAGRTISPVSVNRAVVTLKLLYHQAQGAWPELRNPCSKIRLLEEFEVRRIVTDDEFAGYCAEAPPDERDVAILMRERGLRPQDACSLTCEQCDFEAEDGLGTFELWPRLTPRLVAVRQERGKTPGSSRTLLMTPTVRKLLLARVAEARRLGTPYLFPMRVGKNQEVVRDRHRLPGSLNRINNRTWRKLGIHERIRLYDQRHTFATLAIRKGVNLAVVQDMLGHTDPKTTRKYTVRNDLPAQRAAFAEEKPERATA
jgi:integrase